MKEGQEGIVLVSFIYINDGWYGDRHRVILTPATNEGFRTKTEAKKYIARLKKYVKQKFGDRVDYQITNNDVAVKNHSVLETYKYNNFGPSISYKHHYVTPQDLS